MDAIDVISVYEYFHGKLIPDKTWEATPSDLRCADRLINLLGPSTGANTIYLFFCNKLDYYVKFMASRCKFPSLSSLASEKSVSDFRGNDYDARSDMAAEYGVKLSDVKLLLRGCQEPVVDHLAVAAYYDSIRSGGNVLNCLDLAGYKESSQICSACVNRDLCKGLSV